MDHKLLSLLSRVVSDLGGGGGGIQLLSNTDLVITVHSLTRCSSSAVASSEKGEGGYNNIYQVQNRVRRDSRKKVTKNRQEIEEFH